MARTAKTRRLSRRLPWLLGATHGVVPAAMTRLSATTTVRVKVAAAAAWLTDRKLRNLPLRRLSLGPRQRRPNQPAVHRTVVIRARGRVIVNIDVAVSPFAVHADLLARGDGGLQRRLVRPEYVRRYLLFVGHVGVGHRRAGTNGIGRIAHEHAILLAAGRRNPGLLVFVIRIARGAASLLHLVLDHRDDRVIGDAALARAIVVQNVTEPKPALLHELPRSRSFSGGIVPSTMLWAP
jgi:hypothetical protein